MNRVCSIHNKTIIEICLDTECYNRNLCHICIREHPISHDSKVRDIWSLAEDDTWLQSLEEKKDQLINEGKALLEQKEVMIELRKFLKETFEKLREELTNKENSILKELDDLLGNDEKNAEIAESDSFLFETEKHLASLEELDFRDKDYYQRVEKGRNFEESGTIRTKNLIDEAQKALRQSLLDKDKISYFENEMAQVVQNLDASHFLLEKPLKSAILDQEVLSKLEDLKNQILEHDPQEAQKARELENDQKNEVYQEQDFPSKVRELFSNAEQCSDLSTCGPKLRFSNSFEVYYCRGMVRGCQNTTKVWGSHPYTCDSDKCTALRHHGISTYNGGYFLVEYVEGKDSYIGTTRNRISSRDWSDYPKSFNVQGRIQLQNYNYLHNIKK